MRVYSPYSTTIFMYNILCVSNRSLCKIDFLTRIEEIANCSPSGIILREKDLTEAEYKILAEKVLEICRKHDVPCILHSFVTVASQLKCKALHLPMHILCSMTDDEIANFSVLGASCHSVDAAIEAEKLGCTYITAGHIFITDCKKGLPPRGIEFLNSVCKSVKIPVYAIGGIDSSNINLIEKSGASGACIMSGLMHCQDPQQYLSKFI